MLAGLQSLHRPRNMQRIRHCNNDRLDFLVAQKLGVVGIAPQNPGAVRNPRQQIRRPVTQRRQRHLVRPQRTRDMPCLADGPAPENTEAYCFLCRHVQDT